MQNGSTILVVEVDEEEAIHADMGNPTVGWYPPLHYNCSGNVAYSMVPDYTSVGFIRNSL